MLFDPVIAAQQTVAIACLPAYTYPVNQPAEKIAKYQQQQHNRLQFCWLI